MSDKLPLDAIAKVVVVDGPTITSYANITRSRLFEPVVLGPNECIWNDFLRGDPAASGDDGAGET
jgi:hypothetical protein